MQFFEKLIKSAIEKEAIRQRGEEAAMAKSRPINAKKLAVQHGDRVYSYCHEEFGLSEWVVAKIDADGYPLIAPLGGAMDEPFYLTYCIDECVTIRDAMLSSVERELQYMLPRVERLQQIKQAAEAGQDLSPFYGMFEAS